MNNIMPSYLRIKACRGIIPTFQSTTSILTLLTKEIGMELFS